MLLNLWCELSSNSSTRSASVRMAVRTVSQCDDVMKVMTMTMNMQIPNMPENNSRQKTQQKKNTEVVVSPQVNM